MNARTFRIGGVHPEENKLTHEVATQVAALPKQAIFPLSQHIGAPAKPVVQKGDKVKVGTLIAEAGGFVSVRTGAAQDSNTILIPHDDAELSMDAAACVGCGACYSACPQGIDTPSIMERFLKIIDEIPAVFK